MPQMQARPGRKKTRRLDQPRGLNPRRNTPGPLAEALAAAHNNAVKAYGSDSGGFHAFHPATLESAGVWMGGFPADTVVTRLSWGLIDPELAQRVLEGDGVE
ncbi:hypothetical protein AB0L22_09215 [Micromonospora haikouensis]|uniref:hypothetical protein n=1 Tax=Micromonospora haikouensis TaxID=686309 RepID=UPI00342EC53F